MPKDALPPLSASQLEVMNAVWELGEATVTDIWKTLSNQRRIARATVQTVLNRLAEKGWLDYRSVGQAFLYKAAVPREATQGRMVKELIDTAFNGSADGLVWALLSDRGVSDSEAKRIRKMIEDAESQSKGKPTKGKKS